MSRYKAYPEYKDSGISWLNDVPSNWECIRLKNIFRIKKKIAGTLGYDVLSITQRGIKVKDTESGDGQLSMDYSKYQLVSKGDFAMNHMDLLTGYVDISKFNGVTSPDYRVFVLEDKRQHPKYFLYLLQLCYIAKIFYPLGQGAAQIGRWRLPTEAFSEFVAPSPCYDEQQAIAAFLDHETAKIDALIEKQQRLIELLKEKRQAVISHAVTKGLNPNAPMKDSGVEWLGEVPAHWIVSPIKHLCCLLKDGTHLPPPRVDEGIPLLSVRNIVNNKFVLREDDSLISELAYKELCKPFTPKSGDVLLAIVGATLGKVAMVNNMPPFHIQRSLAIFRTNPDLLINEFLADVFYSSEFQCLLWENVGFSAQPGIYLGVLENFKIPIPPISEQLEIIDFCNKEFSRLDELIQKAESVIGLLQERRTALISAAVTGKIDVRDWQPAAA